MTTPIQDVSETALMVAMWRSLESRRPEPLFHDHLAESLAGERGREIMAGASRMRRQVATWMMAIRTRLIDDLIRNGIQDGADVILNLGAGLDTRPYRMSLPERLLWIEVDYAKMIDLKEARLAEEKPVCTLERIRCDLADASARKALFSGIARKGQNILVLTEGLIPYLTEDDVGALADDLRTNESFRFWIADYFAPFIRRYRKRVAKKEGMENAPFVFEPKDYFEFFLSHGWCAKEVNYVGEAAEKLKRPPPFLLRLWAAVRAPFMSQRARQEMRHAMAYVLFEPTK